MPIWIQYLPYLVVPFVLAIPLGKYIAKVITGQHNFMSIVIEPVEYRFYRWFHVSKREMSWKKYLLNVLMFSFVSFLILIIILKFQNYLPGNPEHFADLSWSLAFNTAISFVTNTNWQAYSGETTLSDFSQSLGLTVQNFASAAVGIAVLFAVIRGFKRTQVSNVGNFWRDLTRIFLYILLPLSLLISFVLLASGVPQSTSGNRIVRLTEPAALNQENKLIYGAKINLKQHRVTKNGHIIKKAKIVTKETLPLYPQASQVAIKQLGTNGGGGLGANSAHPYENPTPVSNLIEATSMLLIPMSLCFSFGEVIKKPKVGWAIFTTMALLFVIAVIAEGMFEQRGTTLSHIGNLAMEGKETRIGIPGSAVWSIITTATSSGATNASLDSFSALGGLLPLALMQLGEVIFGGVGSGLYGMLGFIILTVFIAGLMVGRTPEYF